jgi:4-hydroxy-3-polyprenylbenzoate decarboxylase
MPFSDLREFISELRRIGELIEIHEPVSPALEITEIADRSVKGSPDGGKALLFRNVVGHEKTPVLINAFSSRKRTLLALGISSWEEWHERLDFFLDPKPAEGILAKFKALPKLGELTNLFPRQVRSGPCQEVVLEGADVDLARLPVLTCWPGDGGPFITLPLVFTRDPVTRKHNVGMYRMQVFDRNTTGMHWQKHKDGAGQMRGYEKAGRRMEVAVAIGGDPTVTFSALAPLPPGVPELALAGFLRGESVPVVRCRTVDIEVPATAEYVLEGYVDPGERRREGPFGDHTGFYSLDDDFPVFHVTAITHRRDPVYQTTIVGKPPMEDCWLGEAVERMFLPVLRKQFPELVDMHLPWAGVFHNLMIVSIDKRYPGQARKVMHGIWGTGQMMFTKAILVVDAGVCVRDYADVAFHVLGNIDPQRDVEMVLGPLDELDHASRLPCFGSKIGFDGTRKLPAEGFDRRWPDELEMAPEVRAKIDALWDRLALGPDPKGRK